MELKVGRGPSAATRSRTRQAGWFASRSDQSVSNPALLHAVEDATALCGAELSEVRNEPWDPNTPQACPSCVARAPAGPE